MIITTARQTTSALIGKAKRLSLGLGLPYKEREEKSIEGLKAFYQEDMIVVEADRLLIFPLQEDKPLFFHPNLAMIRAKRWLKGEKDPFISTAGLGEGMSILDCTMGLASDSIMASLAVGAKGAITAVEGNPLLAFIVEEGLHTFTSGIDELERAMRRIRVVQGEHYSFLQNADSQSFDVVYFDPMFQEKIEESNGIEMIKGQALVTDLTPDIISEAKRVARKRVVLKDHWKSERFTKLGFHQFKRKTSLFHYGTIEMD